MKKVRIGHLSLEQTNKFLAVLDSDFKKFSIVPINTSLIINAKQLVVKYGLKGLRTLDAIQLASLINVKSLIDVAITGDMLLKDLFLEEGINCDF